MSDIGKRIKDLRVESGITQLQLGEYCDCTGQVISNIERGYTKPDVEMLNKIAKQLKVPSDYLLGITNYKWMSIKPYSADNHLQKRLSALMDDCNVSKEELSDRSGVPVDDISNILSGELKPNMDALAKMSDTLETTMNYLIGASETPTAIASEDEKDIILYFRSMDKKKRRMFMGELEKIMNM